MSTILGMCKIFLGIATLGLLPAFRPGYVHWSPPPDYEGSRTSMQRRRRPEGYPWKNDSNTKWKLRKSLTSRERFDLFWTCPVVLFAADKIIDFFFTLIFTVWFAAHRQAVSSGKHRITIVSFNVSGNLDLEPLHGVEIAGCVYFCSSFLRECTEIVCRMAADRKTKKTVLANHFSSFWNALDLGEILAFFVGIIIRVSCNGQGCKSTRRNGLETPNVDVGEDTDESLSDPWSPWSVAYGVCLAIAWFRTLRLQSPLDNFRNDVVLVYRFIRRFLYYSTTFIVSTFLYLVYDLLKI